MSKRPDPTPWRAVHGILLLDKPHGLSSNQALQSAKRLFRAEKAGHTGSLDPMATGLLPLCFGEATKIAGLLLGAGKAYAAEIRLGITTDTADADGAVVQERPVPALDRAALEAAMGALRGRIVQVPPAYSAIKQGGERLYAKARRGEAVTVPPREVEVHRFDLAAFDGERLRVEVECGSGTYIRSLAADLGEALGCGAHLTMLRRTWVDPFRTPRMVTLDDLAAMAGQGDGVLDACLIPLEAGLAGMPALRLSDEEATKLRQGQVLPVDADDGLYRVHGASAGLIALGEVRKRILRTQRGLNPGRLG